MATKTAFNVAVVGYGLSAKVFHIPFILALPEDFHLYGIVQRSPPPNDDASKDHPKAKSWRAVEDVDQDPAVDVVILTTIPETHFDFTKTALEHGKHVVVEKPFVPSSQEANERAEAAEKTGKLLAVYQNRRWDADHLTLCKILNEGSLGDVVEFETPFDRHRPDPPADHWKARDAPANGAIYDLGTHLIDQVYNLYGLPQRVTGCVGNQRRGGHGGPHDSCTVLLHYPGPLLVTVKAGVVSPEVEQLRYWIRGTKGSFKKFNLDVQETQLRSGTHRLGDEGFGVDPESSDGFLTTMVHGEPSRETYPTVAPVTSVEYYRVLAEALRGEGEVPVKAEEARDVLRVIELAVLSSRGGEDD